MILRRKGLRIIVILIIILSLIISAGITAFASRPSFPVGVRRLYGASRYETSINVASRLKSELNLKKFDNIVVTTGNNYPDALAGSFFAISSKAPLLLVNPSDGKISVDFISENISRLGKVYILGGEGAVPKELEDEILKVSHSVERIAGPDRYATNAVLLHRSMEKGQDLIICSGKNYPDALSATAVGKPILLVNDDLTTTQLAVLIEKLTPKSKVYIIGGATAVSAEVEKRIRELGVRPRRIGGDSRYSTSTAIAKTFFPNSSQAVLATGEDYPDSLSGAILANAVSSPLLLTSNKPSFQTARSYIQERGINKVLLVGGSGSAPINATGFDRDGNKISGIFSVGKDRYYANSEFNIEKNKVLEIDGMNYYADESGVISQNRTVEINDNSYFANSNGILTKAAKIVYLTFDDGPGPYTEKLIGILDKYNAKATFFVNTWRTEYLDIIGKAHKSGHAIGNHTASHDYAIYSSSSRFWDDVAKANEVIKEQTGSETHLLRFIGGSSNTISKNYAEGIMAQLVSETGPMGYTYFDWDADSYDAGGASTPREVTNNIINGIEGNQSTIVLCHDIKSYTVDGIERVLQWGSENGYIFLPLDENSPTAHHGTNN